MSPVSLGVPEPALRTLHSLAAGWSRVVRLEAWQSGGTLQGTSASEAPTENSPEPCKGPLPVKIWLNAQEAPDLFLRRRRGLGSHGLLGRVNLPEKLVLVGRQVGR